MSERVPKVRQVDAVFRWDHAWLIKGKFAVCQHCGDMRRSGSAGKGGKCTGPVLVREGGK